MPTQAHGQFCASVGHADVVVRRAIAQPRVACSMSSGGNGAQVATAASPTTGSVAAATGLATGGACDAPCAAEPPSADAEGSAVCANADTLRPNGTGMPTPPRASDPCSATAREQAVGSSSSTSTHASATNATNRPDGPCVCRPADSADVDADIVGGCLLGPRGVAPSTEKVQGLTPTAVSTSAGGRLRDEHAIGGIFDGTPSTRLPCLGGSTCSPADAQFVATHGAITISEGGGVTVPSVLGTDINACSDGVLCGRVACSGGVFQQSCSSERLCDGAIRDADAFGGCASLEDPPVSLTAVVGSVLGLGTTTTCDLRPSIASAKHAAPRSSYAVTSPSSSDARGRESSPPERLPRPDCRVKTTAIARKRGPATANCVRSAISVQDRFYSERRRATSPDT